MELVKRAERSRLPAGGRCDSLAEFSFDIVSDYDQQELVNAIDQTHREMSTRYDLKNSKSSLDLDGRSIVIVGDTEHVVGSILDVLESKMVRRGLSLKVLKPGRIEPAAGATYRLRIELQRGINADLARDISKLVRSGVPKVRVAIQGEAVRVVGKSKDELQQVIALVRSHDYPVPLQFVNYR